MEENRTLVEFLKELRREGYTQKVEEEDGYDISKDLICELSNLGTMIYTINFIAPFPDVWQESKIYCLEGHVQDAIKWIMQFWGCEKERYLYECEYKNDACINCKWDYLNKTKSFVLPVRILTSIQVENYDGENYLNNFEFETI